MRSYDEAAAKCRAVSTMARKLAFSLASRWPNPRVGIYCGIPRSISRTISMNALAAGESVRPRLVMKP